MPPGVIFRIGGALDPSYKTALAQSVAEARAANLEVAASNASAAKVNLGFQEKAFLVSRARSLAEQSAIRKQLNDLKLVQAALIAKTPFGATNEKVRVADEIAKKEAAIQLLIAKRTTLELAKIKNDAGLAMSKTEIALLERSGKQLTAIKAKNAAEQKIIDAETTAALIRDTSGHLEWAQIAEEEKTAAVAKNAAERVAIIRAEQLAETALVARGYGAGIHTGAHGKTGVGGVVSEVAVIGHEVLQGRGGGRILGSISILGQRLGWLRKIIKTSADADVDAATASKIASQAAAARTLKLEEMAAATILAKGATSAEAIADTQAAAAALLHSNAVEVQNKKMVEKAEIARATAVMDWASVFRTGLVVAAIAAVAVATYYVIHAYYRASAAAKNLTEALNPLKNQLSDIADEQLRMAEAVQKETDYLRDLNDQHQTEVELLAAKIKLLKEEQSARRKTMEAHGAGQSELQAFDLASLEARKKMLEAEKKRLELEKTTSQEDQAMAAAQADSGAHIKDPKTGQSVNHAGAKEAFENAKKIADAAAAEKLRRTTTSHFYMDQFGVIRHGKEYMDDDSKLDVKVGEKDYGSMTVAEARANLAEAQSRIEKLVVLQKKYDDIKADATKTADEKAAGLKQVKSDIDEVNGEIKIAKTDPASKKEQERRSTTERERIGIGAPQVANLQKQTLDVAKLHLLSARRLNSQIDKLIAAGHGSSSLDGW